MSDIETKIDRVIAEMANCSDERYVKLNRTLQALYEEKYQLSYPSSPIGLVDGSLVAVPRQSHRFCESCGKMAPVQLWFDEHWTWEGCSIHPYTSTSVTRLDILSTRYWS